MTIECTYWNGCRAVTETYKCVGYVKPLNRKYPKRRLILGRDIIILSAKKVKP